MADPNLPVILLNMTSKTKENKNDCGIFAMRHLETYMGQPDGSYKSGFPKEGPTQIAMLEKVRSRYAYSILMSDINLKKNDILEYAKAYNKNPTEKRDQDAYNAFLVIKERLKNAY